jgi:hypothetical protein
MVVSTGKAGGSSDEVIEDLIEEYYGSDRIAYRNVFLITNGAAVMAALKRLLKEKKELELGTADDTAVTLRLRRRAPIARRRVIRLYTSSTRRR